MKAINTLVILITMFAGSLAVCKVDLKKTRVLSLPDAPKSQVDTQEIQQRILPKSVSEQDGPQTFLASVVDNSISLWWETTPLRESRVGQVAEAAEKKLNVSAEFEDRNKVKHTMMVKVLAMQALARLEYRGWVRAALSYDAKAAKTEAEISDRISDTQDVVISHSVNQTESKSQLGFRWSW
jgi:hypothetical protein